MRDVAGRVRLAAQKPLDVRARETVGVASGACLLHRDFRLSKAGLGEGACEGTQGAAVASRPVEVRAAELQARRGAEDDVDEDLADERFFGPPDEIGRAVSEYSLDPPKRRLTLTTFLYLGPTEIYA